MTHTNDGGRSLNAATLRFLHELVPIADDMADLAAKVSRFRAASEAALGQESELTDWAVSLEAHALRCAGGLDRRAAEAGHSLATAVKQFKQDLLELGSLIAELDDNNNNRIDWDDALVELLEEGNNEDE